MFRKLLVTAAVSAALSVAPAYAKEKEKASSQASASSPSEQAEGTQIYLDASAVQQVQQALNAKGFNAGTVDGQWSSKTTQSAQEYQRANGLEPTGTLTVELLNSLGMGNLLTGKGGQGGGAQSSQGAASAKGVPVYVSSTGVRQVQQALSQQGFPVESVDGRWGPGTEKAVENFQRVNNLEPTGKLDTGLISALGVGQQIFSAGKGQGAGQQGQQQAQQQSQQQQAQQSQRQGQPPQGQQQAQSSPSQQQGQQQAQQGQQGQQQQAASGQQGEQPMARQGQPQQAPQGQPQQQPQQQAQSQQGQPQQGQQQQAQSSLQWSRKAAAGKGTPLWAGPETVRLVQQALNRSGFGVDSVDGDWDRQTAQSLRKYQQSKGLAPTGSLTVQTLASLGMSNVLTGQGGAQQQQQQPAQRQQAPGAQQGQQQKPQSQPPQSQQQQPR